MPKVKRKCKNCGKEFEACRSFYANDGEFRWQNVACSPECGAIYLAAVLSARCEDAVSAKESKETTEDDTDEEDVLFEEDFEDGTVEPDINM